MSDYTLRLGEMSKMMLHTSVGSFDITSLMLSFEINESIFSPFINGVVRVEDTESVRLVKVAKLQSDLSCRIEFSFSGLDDDGESPQQAITLKDKDYYVYKIVVGSPMGIGNQNIDIFFTHKSFLIDENSNVSKSYKKKKISEMVSDLGKKIDLKWNTVESTKNTFCFVLPYRTTVEQIMFLTPYARRQENDNDVNYVFYQDLTGKHSFVSIGKLLSQESTFGEDVKSGYTYGINQGRNFKSARRSVISHATKSLNEYKNATNGMHSSAVMTLDPVSKIWAATTMFLPDLFKKQSHLADSPIVEDSSEFYDFVNGGFSQRYYEKSRHSHCCKEQKNGNNKIGGADDWLLPRISSMEQLNQTGIQFFVTGNSDTSKVSAGKVIFFGRPLLNSSVNSSEGDDVTFAGKYLITTITHIINKVKSGKIEYGCSIKAIKDSYGEE